MSNRDESEREKSTFDFELGRGEVTFFICEAICILFYGLFVDYGFGSIEEGFVDKSSPLTKVIDEGAVI